MKSQPQNTVKILNSGIILKTFPMYILCTYEGLDGGSGIHYSLKI